MKSFVYFISYKGGPIKIGRATDVKKRLRALQTSHHETLFVLGVINESRISEGALHEKFEALWLRGEWFARTADLIAFIGKHRSLEDYPESSGLKKIRELNPNKDSFGPVQEISGLQRRGWWDNCESEIEATCAFCEEAETRGIRVDACNKCEYAELAVVYFDDGRGSYELVEFEELRPLDQEEELEDSKLALSNFIAGFSGENNLKTEDKHHEK